MTQVLPWQADQRNALWEIFKKKRMPHALLLTGESELEERVFAQAFSEAILCDKVKTPGVACENCASCRLIQAGSHPDFVSVEPEKSSAIKIDQIRELTHFFQETAMRGGYRIVVIQSAHQLNIAASNALLKTLEEPTANTFIMLVTSVGLRLPQTILSRCQKIVFKQPAYTTALQWMETPDPLLLNLGGGSPLKAQSFDEGFKNLRNLLSPAFFALAEGKQNPVQLAQSLISYEISDFFTIFLNWLYDLARFKLTKGQTALLNSDCHEAIANLSLKISSERLFNFRDIVLQRYQPILRSQNLNKQLIFEELLIRWTHVFS